MKAFDQKKENYTVQDAAGVKLLAAALQRNAQAVARRYRSKGVRELCFEINVLGEQILQAVDDDKSFTVVILLQDPLPNFFLTDEAYGELD